jgi:hypothetical protein
MEPATVDTGSLADERISLGGFESRSGFTKKA